MKITGLSPVKTPMYCVLAKKGGVLETIPSSKESILTFVSSTIQ